LACFDGESLWVKAIDIVRPCLLRDHNRDTRCRRLRRRLGRIGLRRRGRCGPTSTRGQRK
jgi:hypothetical protein